MNAGLVLGDDPSPAVLAAGAEVAARLGFETMAMDLPLSRNPEDGQIGIVVGRAGLEAAGLRAPGIDPTSLDSGEGAVAVREEDGRTWVLVVGGDEEGLRAAARLFAGVLPHTRTLSTARLDAVRDDLAETIEADGVSEATVRLTQARVRAGQAGVGRVIAEIEVDEADRSAAAELLRGLSAGEETPDADEPEETEETEAGDESTEAEARQSRLAYPGLESVEARLVGGPTIRIAGRAAPDAPGPIAGRPGSGGKSEMDLSNLYTSEGLLGGGRAAQPRGRDARARRGGQRRTSGSGRTARARVDRADGAARRAGLVDRRGRRPGPRSSSPGWTTP